VIVAARSSGRAGVGEKLEPRCNKKLAGGVDFLEEQHREHEMRLALIAFATLVAASAAGVQPSDAQSRGPKPWCIADGAYGPGSLDCTYWSFQQCLESARGAGGSCTQNPLLWRNGRFENVEEPRRRGTRHRSY
jgi:hypothetical protein